MLLHRAKIWPVKLISPLPLFVAARIVCVCVCVCVFFLFFFLAGGGGGEVIVVLRSTLCPF